MLYRLDGEVARALTQRHFASFKGKASVAAADAVASSAANPGTRFRLWRMQRACGKRWRWAVEEVSERSLRHEGSTSVSGGKSLSRISSNDSGKSFSSMGGDDDEVPSSDEHFNFRHERMGSADVKSSSTPGASLFDPPRPNVMQLTVSGPGAPSTRLRRNTAAPGSARPLSFKLLVGVAGSPAPGESEDSSISSTVTSPLLQNGGGSPIPQHSSGKSKKNFVRRVKSEYNPPQHVHTMGESEEHASGSNDSTSERNNMRFESLGRPVQQRDLLLQHVNSNLEESKALRVLVEGFLDRKSKVDPTTSRGSATDSADGQGAGSTTPVKWKRRYCTVAWDEIAKDWRLVYFHAGFLPSHVFQEPDAVDGSSNAVRNTTTSASSSNGEGIVSKSGDLSSELWSLFLRRDVTAVRLLPESVVGQGEATAPADAEALGACFVVELAHSDTRSKRNKANGTDKSCGEQDNGAGAATVQQRVFRAENADDALRWVHALQRCLERDSTPNDVPSPAPPPPSRPLETSLSADMAASSPIPSTFSIADSPPTGLGGDQGFLPGSPHRGTAGVSTASQYEPSVITSRSDWI